MNNKLVVVAHNIRSAHNVGSIFRSAEALGADKLYLTGYSPYPKKANDERLPHIANKTADRIKKISLGSEDSLDWEHSPDIIQLLKSLKNDGYQIVALEQHESAVKIENFKVPEKTALVLGSEVGGVSNEILNQADLIVEIPLIGKKDSLNVAVASAIAIFYIKNVKNKFRS